MDTARYRTYHDKLQPFDKNVDKILLDKWVCCFNNPPTAKRNRFAFSYYYQQGFPRSLSGKCLLVLVITMVWGIHLSVKVLWFTRYFTRYNRQVEEVHIRTTSMLKHVFSWPAFSHWQFGSPAPHSALAFGMSASLLVLPFPSELHMPLKKKSRRGSLCVEGGGEAWGMKWDTFMEYCMLNNRLREGVMSLSRKHKHYVLIRRLIINKVQGRCSESRLFHWYLLGQRAPLIGQLKSTLLQSLIGITTFTDFLGTVLPFSLPLR